MLIYIANWPSSRIENWNTLLKARAIENLSYVIGVNRVGTDQNSIGYSGHSGVYDPTGKQLTIPMENSETIIQIELSKSHIQKIRQNFPAHLDSDKFMLK
jgi:predicted amidohydrolase